MRCLTLANKLRENGASVQFICREFPGNICSIIQENGFIVHKLPLPTQRFSRHGERELYEQWLGETWETDVVQTCEVVNAVEKKFDLLVVDHYAIDNRWESQIRSCISQIMVIDDLANRSHDCDLLLDQNFYENMETRYAHLLPEHCVQLLGPSYALLREEFIEAQKNPHVRDGFVRRIFVFFGGSDPTNETEKALEAIKLLNRDELTVDVVVGNSNPNRERIRELCSQITNTYFHCQINNIAELMVKADLAIGAGGSTTWERCSVGLPTLTVTTAENQVEVTDAVAKVGAIYHLGHYNDVSTHSIADALHHLLLVPELLESMSRTGYLILDNFETGGSTRIAEIILAREVLC
ncbi:UDP-2,4-diacetamido-2,4,6-trideoxy-beta-L-altropyranose hydrolase [Paenibacillus sp. HWE-109]|nr:UDP-2,4-diacetamido-2,4,6-trideoxy-beta-L-altropyranose hydrolase [Paenibacillus sp. HWE-109]